MNEALISQAQSAIAKGRAWLSRHEEDIRHIADLSAHYKAPYLYAVLGDPARARYYAELMRHRYQQPDGDFRTTPTEKGWGHLPCSPANRYLYSNGWIIVGLQKLGCYGAARRGLEFLLRLQSDVLGGFFSRFDPQTSAFDERYLDSSSTSSAGLALLACGNIERAIYAGDFILRLIEAQPEPQRFFFASWEVGDGPMTDIWGEEDANAIRGRKQYRLSTEADPQAELIWLIGKPMKFLCKLYDATGDARYLAGAEALFDFFHRLDEGRWQNYASCKIMWGAAELFHHTRERRFAQTAERLLSWMCTSQYPDGLWVHGLWYRRPEDQPLAASLDIVQELCAEISDTLFDLSPSAAQRHNLHLAETNEKE